MSLTDKSITSVRGVKAGSRRTGLKKRGKDLLVLYAEKECSAAVVSTRNRVRAAPVLLNLRQMRASGGKAQAVVVNSGNANACTGERGMRDAKHTAELAAEELGIEKSRVLVSSTGVIGKHLDMKKIEKGIKGIKKEMSSGSKHGNEAARAIITTDTYPKQSCVDYGGIRIAAIAKGSGMIHPNMGTMLCFIATNASVRQKDLQKVLADTADATFNMISVDGDTSTNDTVIALATGEKKTSTKRFRQAMEMLCTDLAKKIAADGEGATKLIEAEAVNAATEKQARDVAKGIISSSLVKAAVFGSDPNWGRIICAAGYSNSRLSQDRIDLYIGGRKVVKAGTPVKFSRKSISDYLKKSREVRIKADLNSGSRRAKAWGCDLSYDYVRINAEYST